MTRKAVSPSVPKSRTFTILGCLSLARVRAWVRKRSNSSLSCEIARSTLIAT